MLLHANKNHVHQETLQHQSKTSPKSYTCVQAHKYYLDCRIQSACLLFILTVWSCLSLSLCDCNNQGCAKPRGPCSVSTPWGAIQARTSRQKSTFVSVLHIHACTCWPNTHTQNIPVSAPNMHTHTHAHTRLYKHCHLSQHAITSTLKSHNN